MFETETVFIHRKTGDFGVSRPQTVIEAFHNRIEAPQVLYPWVPGDE